MRKRDLFIFIWYLLPYLYLLFIKGVFLPLTGICLLLFFSSYFISLQFSKNFHIDSTFKFPSMKWIDGIIFLILLLQIWTIYRLSSQGLNLLSHRNLIWDDPSYLFGNSILLTLYTIFLIPCVVIYTIILVVKGGQKRIFYLCLFILFIDSIIMLGRFQILYIFFLLVIGSKSYKISFYRFIFIFFLLFVSTQFIIYFRQFFSDSSVDSPINFITIKYIENSIINYQYFGFLVFERLTSDTPFFGNLFSFNLLNFPFYLLSLVLTRFGVFISNPWEGINLKLSEGYYFASIDSDINAFSTNFLPIYLDFGLMGILVFGIFAGIIFGIRGKSKILNFVQILLLFVIIFGLYQPLILSIYGFTLFLFVVLLLVIKKIKTNLNNDYTKY